MHVVVLPTSSSRSLSPFAPVAGVLGCMHSFGACVGQLRKVAPDARTEASHCQTGGEVRRKLCSCEMIGWLGDLAVCHNCNGRLILLSVAEPADS